MNSTLELPVTSETVNNVAKILIVEDSITFQALHQGYLTDAGYESVCVSSGEEALQTLELEHFDIILMDVTMPGLDGYETAELIREQYGERWIPIIFIAGHEEDEHYHKAIESGGDDYLIKPVREAALISKVKAICRILKMQDGLKAAQKEFEHQSRTDVLTGLFTRRAVMDEAETQWHLLTRLRHPIAVLLIDIDFFKLYNDHYGHHGGDQCLFNVAEVLRNCFSRDTDLVGRLGGEEFLVVLPNTTTVMATELAKRLQRRLAKEDFEHIKSPMKRVTISIGCAACHSLKDHDFESLVKHADDLLYEAKRSGRDTVAWDEFPTSHQLLDETIDIPVLTDEVPKAGVIDYLQKPYVWVGIVAVCVLLIGLSWWGITSSDPEVPQQAYVTEAEEPVVVIEPVIAEPDLKDELVEDSENLLAEGRAILEESRALLAESEPDATPDAVSVEETQAIEPVVVETEAEPAVVEAAVELDSEPLLTEVIKPTPEEKVTAVVNAWKNAWTSQDETVFDYYHPAFRSSAGTPFSQWKPLRWQRINKPDFIEVELGNLSVVANGSQYVATFEQRYRSDTMSDFGIKTLVFQQDASKEAWLIVSETFSAL